MQQAGESLDKETDGKWVADEVAKLVDTFPKDAILVLDSVRIPKQVEHLRKAFGKNVWHVHLTASDASLMKRFADRKNAGDAAVKDLATYDEARNNQTEAAIEVLAKIADECLMTDRLDPQSVATLAVHKLDLFPTASDRLVDVVVGGQYGSEGKGNICNFLAGEYDVLMRVGGPNAGHKVIEPEYTYVHMPSGTKGNPKAQILIGAGATLNIVRVFQEIIELELTPQRLSIDPQAIVIEQSDRDLEEQLGRQIGSTKKGVGIATARKIVGRGDYSDYLAAKKKVKLDASQADVPIKSEGQLGARVRLAQDVEELKSFVRPVNIELENAYRDRKRILLEGTQGTELSLHHGIYPNVTSRETTTSGCLADAGIPPHRVGKVFMVTRTYPIRVGGDSGEMGTEIRFETISERSGIPLGVLKRTEVGTISNKPRRVAEFSWERVRRAVQINGATDIVLTFADYLSSNNENARNYPELSDETREMIEKLEELTGVSVSIIASGAGNEFIIDRRQT